jgi:copper chaperone CopZ
MITICHSVLGSERQTINIPQTEWALHAAHGDTQGACPAILPPNVVITSPNTSPVTLENCIASVTATVENITNRQGIMVTQNGAPVNFNFSGNTVTVSNIAFTGTADFIVTAKNSAGTSSKSTSFICKPPVVMITICHSVLGSEKQTINIPQTEWASHAAHGDTQGACPAILPPNVLITSPNTSPVTLENCIASVIATVENITNRQGITVTQNGAPVNFNFVGNTITVSNISFTGTADFIITAKNSAGTSSKSTSFICKPPVVMITICHSQSNGEKQTINIPQTEWALHAAHGDTQGACPVILPPNVVITSPNTSPVTLENCVASVTATVENITNRQGITVTQNGAQVNFNFVGNTVTVSNISFTGTADFVVTAKNSAGTSSKSTSFICQPPVVMITICHTQSNGEKQTINIPQTEWASHAAHGDTQGACPAILPPNVVITSPNTSPVTLENCVASVTATVENITNRQGITVTQNGAPVNFNFVGNTVTVSNISFTGTADFIVTAKNSAGTSSKSTSFICQPPVVMITICHTQSNGEKQTINIPQTEWASHAAHGDTQGVCPVILPPNVVITSPNTSPVTLENCVASVTATVENVSNRQGITVTQNGAPVNFNFSGNTITVSNVSFTGTANFIVTATNSAGSSAKTVSFICQPKEKEIAICHYPPGNRDNPQAINIPESAWAAHEAHGDVKGTCALQAPVVDITSPNTSSVTVEDCHASVVARVQNIKEKQSISVTENGKAIAFDFSNGTVRVPSIAFTGTAIFVVTATNGAGSSNQTVTFICQPKEKEIAICHYPPGNRDNPQAINIPESAWAAHEGHGDVKGACALQAPVVDITSPNTSSVTVEDCHASVVASVQNIKEKQSISVTENGKAIAFEFSNGVVRINNLAFTGSAVFVVTAKNGEGTTSQSVTFICQPKEIGICHYPPGNRDNPQSITVSESAWPAHEAHGDLKGACPSLPDPVVDILSPNAASVTVEDCKANIQASVKNIEEKKSITVTRNGSAVAFDFNGGNVKVSNLDFTGTATFVVTATNGSGSSSQTVTFVCQPREIGICHYPPGNRDNPQDISVPESAWRAHEAHGDVQGVCPTLKEPVVDIVSPKDASVTVEDCKASFQASVQNILEKKSITVMRNGKAVAFTFEGNNVKVSNLTFTGTATFVIKASNKSGSASQSVEFICKPPEPKKEDEKEDDKDDEKDDKNKITICHQLSDGKFETIVISKSEWEEHEKHGDKQGRCE